MEAAARPVAFALVPGDPRIDEHVVELTEREGERDRLDGAHRGRDQVIGPRDKPMMEMSGDHTAKKK